MMISITPNINEGEVKAFCAQIQPDSKPMMVYVRSEPKFKANFCYDNVKLKMSHDGGRILTGWRIWKCPNLWMEAIHHAVWVSEELEIVDVTPQDEKVILFLPDKPLETNGCKVGEKYFAIADDPLIKEYVELCQKESDNYKSKTPFLEDVRVPDNLSLQLRGYEKKIASTYVFDEKKMFYVKR